jgi:hypothetical protein
MAVTNQIAERLTAFSSARTNTANTSNAMVSPDKIVFFKELNSSHVGKRFKVFSKGKTAPGSNEPSYTNEGSLVLKDVGGSAPVLRSRLTMRSLQFSADDGHGIDKYFSGLRTDFETSFVVKEYEDALAPVVADASTASAASAAPLAPANEDPSRRRRNRKSRRHRTSRRSTRRRRN